MSDKSIPSVAFITREGDCPHLPASPRISRPRQVSCDGCFASRSNLEWAKTQGVQDVAFAKKRGLKVPEMVRSS